MCRRFLCLTLFLGFLLPAAALADDEQRARAYVEETVEAALTVLRTSKSRAEREAGFRKLLAERTNMRRIARFTLGRYGREVAAEDFKKFQALLNELIVKVYANRLNQYSNETVTVTGSQSKGANFIVASRINFTDGRDPVSVDWWLRKEKDGRFTLFDVRVLGVWMAQEQRDSFSSVLKNNNGDIEALMTFIRRQVEGDVLQ